MARYDNKTPKDVLEKIRLKKSRGYFVQRIQDKKFLAQHYEVILKDKEKANEIYDQIREDLQKKLIKSPKGSTKELAKFLRNVQIKETGSFVEQPNNYALEIERAKHILRHLKNEGLKPKYPLKFLNKVDSGKKLKKYFRDLLYDFSKNNDLELNLAITGLLTIKRLGFHRFSKDWDRAYYDVLEMWQDPKTGYWGPWRKEGRKIIKETDISTTFHILRLYYNKDSLELNNPKYAMKYKKQLLKTTWKLKDKNWPYGWLQDGKLDTHHSFDIVEIFLYLFNEMGNKEKQKVRNLFHRLLKWDLTENLQKNGGFIGHYPGRVKKPTMMLTNFAILVLRGIGYYSPFYREVIWKGVKLPVNSFRIYEGEVPKNEYDTKNLKAIVYTKKTTLDPLDVRKKVFGYWSKNKHDNPSEAIHVNMTLKFEEFPVNDFKVLRKIPKLKKGEILVKVDRYGGII